MSRTIKEKVSVKLNKVAPLEIIDNNVLLKNGLTLKNFEVLYSSGKITIPSFSYFLNSVEMLIDKETTTTKKNFPLFVNLYIGSCEVKIEEKGIGICLAKIDKDGEKITGWRFKNKEI